MGIDGNIVVTESNKKGRCFENYKLKGNVEYILNRDPETKKFPTLTVGFNLYGYVDCGIYATVCIPKANFISCEAYEYDEERDEMGFDDKIEINHLVYEDCDELTVYIFTYIDCLNYKSLE